MKKIALFVFGVPELDIVRESSYWSGTSDGIFLVLLDFDRPLFGNLSPIISSRKIFFRDDEDSMQSSSFAAIPGYAVTAFFCALQAIRVLGYECLLPDNDQTERNKKLWKSVKNSYYTSVCMKSYNDFQRGLLYDNDTKMTHQEGVKLNYEFSPYLEYVENGMEYYNDFLNRNKGMEYAFSRYLMHLSDEMGTIEFYDGSGSFEEDYRNNKDYIYEKIMKKVKPFKHSATWIPPIQDIEWLLPKGMEFKSVKKPRRRIIK